jgi:lysophospholipase L1-like esterase
MKYLVYLLLFLILFIGCSNAPLQITLTSDNQTIFIHSQDNFLCAATGGKEEYQYRWNIDDKQADCAENSCKKIFDSLGKHDINCEVFDGKTRINRSMTIEVIKIPKRIGCIFGFGDSLTAAYGVKPEESWISLYSRNFDDVHLFNYAASDSTSYNVSEQQTVILAENDYSCKGSSLVFLWFGANDVKNFVSLEQFRNNYIKTIDSLSAIQNKKIILITIPDVSKLSVADEVQTNVNDFLSQFGVQLEVKKISQDIIRQYNNVIFSIAKEYDLDVIDMFDYMQNFDNSLIGLDKFHPNAQGHEEISGIISKEVDKMFLDYRLY